MKINQDVKTTIEKAQPEIKQSSSNQMKFHELVQKQDSKMHVEQLNKLMKDIEVAGNLLARSRTFKDLTKYKALVKRFVEQAVDFGMDLKQSHSWNARGQGRKLKIIENIDQELIDLADTLIDQESNSISLLNKIGIIKGLLINLYT
ncbi:YaaR family protein [Cytobacillus sp. IB215665]|uniref:YaaR family protein n=1 Tax=Cytobacillus sp. IB215665 TaxID=3097357 RepID=UPI002A10E221|nr:YaaR family protein [Cytobacillus sp. IB215665]MDX8367606.1 YaaR family protein [Cytobacillus sp. IB215665]